MRRALRVAADLVFALRPLLWIPAIALFAAGEIGGALSSGAPGTLGGAGGGVHPGTAASLGSLLLLLGAVHVANGWRDRAGDRVNRKGLVVASGAIPGFALAMLGGACVVAALSLAFHPALRAGSRALLAGAALLGAAYVTPGVELKRRSGLDLASHGVGYGVVAFLLGAESAGRIGSNVAGWGSAMAAAAPYAAGVLAVALVTMIADAPGDGAAGQRTLAVALGGARAWSLARALAWTTALAGLLVGEWIPALWGVLGAVVLSLRGSEEPSAANRVAIVLQLVFLTLVAPRAPVAAGVAVAIAAAASAYGAWRWGEGYPWSRISVRRACT